MVPAFAMEILSFYARDDVRMVLWKSRCCHALLYRGPAAVNEADLPGKEQPYPIGVLNID